MGCWDVGMLGCWDVAALGPLGGVECACKMRKFDQNPEHFILTRAYHFPGKAGFTGNIGARFLRYSQWWKMHPLWI